MLGYGFGPGWVGGLRARVAGVNRVFRDFGQILHGGGQEKVVIFPGIFAPRGLVGRTGVFVTFTPKVCHLFGRFVRCADIGLERHARQSYRPLVAGLCESVRLCPPVFIVCIGIWDNRQGKILVGGCPLCQPITARKLSGLFQRRPFMVAVVLKIAGVEMALYFKISSRARYGFGRPPVLPQKGEQV